VGTPDQPGPLTITVTPIPSYCPLTYSESARCQGCPLCEPRDLH
jgi:hypothetical protein